MDIKETIRRSINRVADTHFFLRPALVNSLKKTIITEQFRNQALGCSNYFEYWEKSLSEKFFDMGTLIRLGTEIENGLKYYYMEKKGHKNLQDLKSDPNCDLGIFQRVHPWTRDKTVVGLFKDQLNYDLNSNSKFKNIQQIMLYRHLYAHNSGLLDDRFMEHYKELTSIDLPLPPEIQKRYPYEDIYYFRPLEALSGYIEDTRAFFRGLP
jgi:hypothetical protein